MLTEHLLFQLYMKQLLTSGESNIPFQWYSLHMEHHEQLLSQLDSALKRHPDFERAFNDFEAQKVCYLPLGAFLMKPIQRLVHYQQLLGSQLEDYFSILSNALILCRGVNRLSV